VPRADSLDRVSTALVDRYRELVSAGAAPVNVLERRSAPGELHVP
jgi:hypothetical protein